MSDPSRPTVSRTAGGRPPTRSVAEVVEAAVAIMDSDGLAAITMRNLGQRLGMSTMGLYRYVETKEQLTALIPDFLLASTAEAVLRQSSSGAALRVAAEGLRDVLRRHPHSAALFARPIPGPAITRAAKHCSQLLVQDGAPADEAFEMVRAVIAQVIGEAVTSHGGSGSLGLDLVLTGIRQRTARTAGIPTTEGG